MKLLNEAILKENKVVTFDGQTYPKLGGCIIMGGGSGVGKSTNIEKLLPINGKKFDVDEIKSFVHKSSEYDKYSDVLRTSDGQEYDLHDIGAPDFSNPKYVSLLHKVSKPLVKSARANLYKSIGNAPKDKLPNLIFDITAKNIEDITNITQVVKPLGYKVCLVYVIGDIEDALVQNASRSRQVDEDLVVSIHNDVDIQLRDFYRHPRYFEDVDDIWIISSYRFDFKDKNEHYKYLKAENVFQVKSKDELIHIPQMVANQIDNQLRKINKIYLQAAHRDMW